jgi:hypothetical protein
MVFLKHAEVYEDSAEPLRMNISGTRNSILTEPNQALQRMNTLVTDRAPSSTLRAKRVHR